MTLEEIKAWLQTVVKSPAYYAGQIDYSQDNCIGVDDAPPIKAHMAIGGIDYSSYDVKCVAFFIHWGQYQEGAELKAYEVYNTVNGNPYHAVIGGHRVIMFEMRFSQPESAGTDKNGIYEYAVHTNIYFEK